MEDIGVTLETSKKLKKIPLGLELLELSSINESTAEVPSV
jgi:hypothetical protein